MTITGNTSALLHNHAEQQLNADTLSVTPALVYVNTSHQMDVELSPVKRNQCARIALQSSAECASCQVSPGQWHVHQHVCMSLHSCNVFLGCCCAA
jgi:hypothetical protein